jgi:hypothetical protein
VVDGPAGAAPGQDIDWQRMEDSEKSSAIGHLPASCTVRIGKSLLTGGSIASGICLPCFCHGRRDRIDPLCRDVTDRAFGSTDRLRRRLAVRHGGGTLTCAWPCGCARVKDAVELGHRSVNLTRTRTGMTDRSRKSECQCASRK